MRAIGLLAVVWICAGCFEIRETITFTSEGKGHYRLVLDLSASRELVTQVIRATSDPGTNPFSDLAEPIYELNDILDSGISQLSYFQGISNLKKIFDQTNLLMGYEFDFAKIENLNSVLAYTNRTWFENKRRSFFSYSKKGEIALNNVYNINELIQGLDNQNDTAFSSTKARLAATATYQLELLFPKKVRKSKNPRYSLSPDKKSLILRLRLEQILNQDAKFGNRIKFK